jgi:hypothetical protein
LYRNSGALPEYCSEFGIMFEHPKQVGHKLEELIDNYDYYFDKLKEYPYNANHMCGQYLELFLQLLKIKNKLNTMLRRFKYIGIFVKETLFQLIDFIMLKAKRIIKLGTR